MSKETDYKRLWRGLHKENIRLSNENNNLRQVIRDIQDQSKKIVADSKMEIKVGGKSADVEVVK